MDNRRFERLKIFLQAEIVLNDELYKVFVTNFSREGAAVTTSPLSEPTVFDPGTSLKLLVELPTGHEVSLSCNIAWSKETLPVGFVNEIGLKIIEPPVEYLEFLKKEGFDVSETINYPDDEVF